MDQKNSDAIASSLKFFRDIQTEYHIALETEAEADKETQDILHRLELEEDSDCDMAKLAKAMKVVRCKRRAAKDKKLEAEPVINWLSENDKFIKSLERLLGEVRKAEKATMNRYYIERTNIVKGIFMEEDKKGGVEGDLL